jgi:uncharacterized membrane protein
MSQNESITPQRRAKHPRTGLAGPYGHPLHPIMVTIPIGVWVASLIFDLANLFGDEHESFSRGAIWLIAIGVVGALLAAILGFLDFTTLTAGTVAHRTAVIHLSINLTVVVLFVIGFIIRVNSDYDRLSIPAFIISIIALIMLTVSGWLGGKLAYHYGVRVADEQTQAEGFRATP